MQQRDARAQEQGFAQVVRHEQSGLAEILAQLEEMLLHIEASHRIERGEWLVEQQQRRIGGECAGDADALFLATGELSRISRRVYARFQSNGVEQFVDAGADLLSRPRFEFGNESDVARDGEVRKQAAVLDHITDAATQPNWIPLRDAPIFEAHLARRRRQQSVHHLEQRRFSRTAAPEQHQGFVRIEAQVDATQHVPPIDMVSDLFEFDEGRHRTLAASAARKRSMSSSLL